MRSVMNYSEVHHIFSLLAFSLASSLAILCLFSQRSVCTSEQENNNKGVILF